MYDVHPLWEVLARDPTFSESWRRPYSRSCHINVGELEAHLRDEARLGATASSVRCLFGLDSQVALGCLIKGRSSSPSLNTLLLRSLAIYAGSDLYGLYGYLPSALNQADHPTRGACPTEPTLDKPSWWDDLAGGNAGPFDEWLRTQSADEVGVVRDDEFAPLGYVRPSEMRVSKQCSARPEASFSVTANEESLVRLRMPRKTFR